MFERTPRQSDRGHCWTRCTRAVWCVKRHTFCTHSAPVPSRTHTSGWLAGVHFHRPSYHINRDFPATNFRRNDSSIAASLEFHRVAHPLFLQITTNDRSSSAPDMYWSKTCTPPPLAPMTGSNVSESPAYECYNTIAIMSLCARQHIVFVLSTISRGRRLRCWVESKRVHSYFHRPI